MQKNRIRKRAASFDRGEDQRGAKLNIFLPFDLEEPFLDTCAVSATDFSLSKLCC